jgi:DNA-binding response OmpR family regulator
MKMEQLKILLVDDEQEFVATLAERLRLRGFHVEATSTGADALQRVREDGFSILILDVKMPGIGGLQLLSQVKATHPDLPIILLSGHDSVADAKNGLGEGAFDYLVKPVNIDELTEKIGSAAGAEKGRP